MSEAEVSLTDKTAPIAAGAFVVAAAFLGDVPALALGDGTVLLPGAGTAQRVAAHDGAILCAACDGRRLLTGGDDGAVAITAVDGATQKLADTGGAWIDAVALGPDGAVAWSAGRKAFVRDGKGQPFELALPSTGRGLAFAPKGFQVAVARYNGVSLWFPRMQGVPKELPWKGSHIDVTFSPDGRFAVSTMQEPALHGWRIADGAHMRMTGYPSKVRSFSWSADGKQLATSGADAAIVWPFAAKDGPMGKPPQELGARQARVTRVAFHPKSPALAIGYEDGMILLVRPTDGAEVLVRRPEPGGPVSALAWSADGARLAFGTEEGEAGVVSLAG